MSKIKYYGSTGLRKLTGKQILEENRHGNGIYLVDKEEREVIINTILDDDIMFLEKRSNSEKNKFVSECGRYELFINDVWNEGSKDIENKLRNDDKYQGYYIWF